MAVLPPLLDPRADWQTSSASELAKDNPLAEVTWDASRDMRAVDGREDAARRGGGAAYKL